ncbi:MAG: ABC transporter substrate-binding protein, partial [Candidatus Bipolaricaulota bacterium]
KTAAYYYGETQNVDTVGFLGIDMTFGQNGVSTAESAFEEYGVETLEPEFAPTDTKNFKPYLQRIKNKDPDILYIVWAGDGFGPLYQDIHNMEMMDKVVGSVIDLFTMNRVNLVSGGLYEGAEGFCYFAYDVNSGPEYDFLVETMKENDIRPDEFAAAFSQEEGDVFDKLAKARVPELWHGQAFATAQFIVEGLRQGRVSDPEGLIKAWEGMELETPLGETLIRPRDHQAVRPMFIAKAVMDTEEDEIGFSDTVGLIIGERMTKVPREYIDPPIKTDYEPAEEK